MRIHSSGLVLALPFILVATVCAAAHAQTDIALSGYGAFGSTSNYNGGLEHQRSASAAGGMFELRHISNPLVGFEATYSFNRANQVYSYTGPTPVGSSPGPYDSSVSANAHQITGDWLFSAHAANFRPFALVGVGLLLTGPTSAPTLVSTSTSNELVYVYGAGLDWGLRPHLGLRFQYRGNVYKAPSITTSFGTGGGFTHTAEPMIGAYFRF
jgi:opacity protein-like surface antigen